MPARPGGKETKSKKKKNKGWLHRFASWDAKWSGNQADDVIEAGTGLPTGLYNIGKAWTGDPKALKEVRSSQTQALEDLGRPAAWRDHTLMNALTLAGIAAPPAKGFGALSAASRASRGAKYGAFVESLKMPPSRKFAGVPKKAGQIPRRYDVPASNSPLVRGARKLTLDPAYKISAKRATPSAEQSRALRDAHKNLLTAKKSKNETTISAAKEKLEAAKEDQGRRHTLKIRGKTLHTTKGGRYAMNQERRQLEKQARYIKQSRGVPTAESKRKIHPIEQAYLAPTNAMRAALPIRPRYYMQNLPSTALMLLTQQPLGIGKSVKQAARMRKNAPELYQQTRNIGGETASSSSAIGAKGALSGAAKKITHLGNIPESHMRTAAAMRELRREGVNPDDYAAVKKFFDAPESAKFQKFASRYNEAVGDYSRLSPKEISFMSSGIPIFYSMNKALGRYTARLPTDHPTLTAVLANLGKKGHQQQEEGFGGPLPPYSPYMIPTGKNKSLNPQNILPWSPGTDLLRAGKTVVDEGVPQWNPLALAGPSPEAAFAAATNRSLQTGWKLKDAEHRSPAENAIREALPLFPGTDIATMLGSMGVPHMPAPRTSEAYPDNSLRDQAINWGVGRGYVNRKTNYAVLRKQGKRAKKSGR